MEHKNSEPEKGESVFANERVLVVDDLEKWLGVSTNNLVYYGCQRENIFWAYNIQDGERIYTAKKPPIAMVDINFDINNLEDTQGLMLISRMKKIKSNGLIIAMSSLTDISPRTLEAGADYFIQKGRQFTEEFDGFVGWYKKI